MTCHAKPRCTLPPTKSSVIDFASRKTIGQGGMYFDSSQTELEKKLGCNVPPARGSISPDKPRAKRPASHSTPRRALHYLDLQDYCGDHPKWLAKIQDFAAAFVLILLLSALFLLLQGLAI